MAPRALINALLCACTLGAAAPAVAAQTEGPAVQPVAQGVNDPAAVALRPDGTADRYEIFVAERGAGRIVKYVSGQSEPKPVIEGFESPVHALTFLDRIRLAVLTNADDRDALVRTYELRDDESISADSTTEQAGVATENGIRRGTDALTLQAVARTIANDTVPDMLVITAAGDERGRALWKMPLRAGTIGELAPFAAKPAGRSAAPPTAVTVGVRGFVVLAYSATDDQPQSELAFYNPINGNRVLQMTCELPNIVALAYSPHSGNLYAASSQADDLTSAISVEPSSENSTGGVYRLDDASQPGARACATTKVADVRNLTAMTFAPDGALYITTKGNDKETSESGALLRITGDL